MNYYYLLLQMDILLRFKPIKERLNDVALPVGPRLETHTPRRFFLGGGFCPRSFSGNRIKTRDVYLYYLVSRTSRRHHHTTLVGVRRRRRSTLAYAY